MKTQTTKVKGGGDFGRKKERESRGHGGKGIIDYASSSSSCPPPEEWTRRCRCHPPTNSAAASACYSRNQYPPRWSRDTTLCGVVVTLILYTYPTPPPPLSPNARCYTTPSQTPNPLNVKRIRTPPSPRERNINCWLASVSAPHSTVLCTVFVLFFVLLIKKKKIDLKCNFFFA